MAIFLIKLSVMVKISAHPDGAPSEACLNMIPKHQSFNAKPFDPSVHEIQVNILYCWPFYLT
jgi:hypothetical protein